MNPRRPTPNPSQLSDRDLAIINDVTSFRALTGNQLRRLHFDHPSSEGSPAGALRSSQRTLKRLCEHGILTTLQRRVGGVRSGSAGLTYVLGYHGQRLIRPDRRARTPETLGDRYVAHTLAVAEVAVALIEQSRHRDIDVIEVQAEPACWRPFADRRRTVTLKPDLFVAVGAGDLEHRWFVEVDLATESLVRVRTKCQSYLDYLATGIETARYGVFPRVAWVVPDRRRADQVHTVINKMPTPATALFTVTLATDTTVTLSGTNTITTAAAGNGEVTESTRGRSAGGGEQ